MGRHRVGAGEPGGDQRPGRVGAARGGDDVVAGQEAVDQRRPEGVAGAEAAHDLDGHRRDGGRALAGRDEDALGALLHEGHLHAGVEQPLGRQGGVGGADRDLDLGAVADDDVDVREHRGQCAARLVGRGPEHRAPVEVEHRVPARAGLGATTVLEHPHLRGAGERTETPVPVTHRSGTSRTRSHGTSRVVEREVGRDRRPVEEQRRVGRRVQLAEDHGGLQSLRRPDVARVDAERRRGRCARSRRSRPAPPWSAPRRGGPAGRPRPRRSSPSPRGTSRTS